MNAAGSYTRKYLGVDSRLRLPFQASLSSVSAFFTEKPLKNLAGLHLQQCALIGQLTRVLTCANGVHHPMASSPIRDPASPCKEGQEQTGSQADGTRPY